MTTQQIAERLVDLCRQAAFETAQKELFSEDVISIEPYATPGFDQETKGRQAVIEKGHKFDAMVKETHGITISDPLTAGNSIAFTLSMDLTMKERGRSTMEELCVYEVKDEKIISERFFM